MSKKKETEGEVVIAIVRKILPDGKHGPFAATVSQKDGSNITFSLKPPVWKHKKWPESGTLVVLEEIFGKPNGFRADKARLYTLKDQQEQGATSNEQ